MSSKKPKPAKKKAAKKPAAKKGTLKGTKKHKTAAAPAALPDNSTAVWNRYYARSVTPPQCTFEPNVDTPVPPPCTKDVVQTTGLVDQAPHDNDPGTGDWLDSHQSDWQPRNAEEQQARAALEKASKYVEAARLADYEPPIGGDLPMEIDTSLKVPFSLALAAVAGAAIALLMVYLGAK